MHAGKNIVASEISSNADETYRYKCIGGNGLRGYVQQFNTEGSFPIIGRQGALCGNINYVEGRFYATEHAVVVDTFCKTNVKWSFYFLIKLNLNQYATATAQPGLSVNTICDVQIPLPPLTEQQRIVAEIERWFALIDTVEQGKADLQTAIKQTKSKILDLAIHGKLVPQDPNDEPASELLKRINPKAQITCDNEHYPHLPKGWVTTDVKSVATVLNGFAFKSANYIQEKGMRIIRIANVQDGFIEDNSPQYYPLSLQHEYQSYILKDNDMLMSLTGNVGRVGLLPKRLLPAALNQRVACIREIPSVIEKLYLYYLFKSQKFIKECISNGKGVAQLNISTEWLKYYQIYIPPLAEQKRIVKKVEELFFILDTIEESL